MREEVTVVATVISDGANRQLGELGPRSGLGRNSRLDRIISMLGHRCQVSFGTYRSGYGQRSSRQDGDERELHLDGGLAQMDGFGGFGLKKTGLGREDKRIAKERRESHSLYA